MTQLEYDPKYVFNRIEARLKQLERVNDFLRVTMKPVKNFDDEPELIKKIGCLQEAIFVNLQNLFDNPMPVPLDPDEWVQFTAELLKIAKDKNQQLGMTFELQRLLALTDDEWSDVQRQHLHMLQVLDWIFNEMEVYADDS